MKKFKRQWNEELNKIVPNLSGEVLNAPIVTDVEKTASEEKFLRKRAVKRFSLCATCAVLAICFAIGVTTHFKQETPSALDGGYAVVLEINPKVMFSVNQEGEVVSVSALNMQADVILSNKERITALMGKTTAESVKLFIDYSAMLGYIDIAGEDAVKISHSDCENFGAVVSEIEKFFKDKGYFTLIFEQEVLLSDFASMLNATNINGIKDLTEKMNELPTLYSERKTIDKTIEEIQDIYKKDVILGDMQKFIKMQIELGFKSGDKLVEIYNLNRQISEHELNPLKFLGIASGYATSYWSVVSYPGMDKLLTKERYAEFKAFIDKMEGLLAEYEREYGVKLDLKSLNTAYHLYCSSEKNVLFEILKSNDDEFYLASLPLIETILPDITFGVDFEDFYFLPSNGEEYNEKMENVFNDLFGAYMGQNHRNYEEDRPPISDIDYTEFMQSKIDKFGSIEKYWESLQKNILEPMQ